MSTLPPFLEVAGARKNNALGPWFTCFLAKKGGQRAPISSGRKIREPGGPADRGRGFGRQRDPAQSGELGVLLGYGAVVAIKFSCEPRQTL